MNDETYLQNLRVGDKAYFAPGSRYFNHRAVFTVTEKAVMRDGYEHIRILYATEYSNSTLFNIGHDDLQEVVVVT